ncbi:MAG: phosphatase domain-containing protein [Myxococcota bacterium]
MHVFRWDLDKTYLHTEFGSVRKMVRTAFESASSKVNTPGSASLLRALQEHDPDSRTTVISGSPKQMRKTLAAKLSLDRIRVDSLTLKDNLGNLRRGRLRAVWGQVGYKLPQLLAERTHQSPQDTESLFGDDAEVDAAVYAVYADAIAGRIDEAQVLKVLQRGGAYEDDIKRALSALRRIQHSNAVEDIFIRLDDGGPVGRFELLGPRVIPVFSWMQAALVLRKRGRLSDAGTSDVAKRCAEAGRISDTAMVSLVQDVVRRHLLTRDDVEEAIVHVPHLAGLKTQIARSLDLLGVVHARPLPPDTCDPIAFMDAVA